MSSECFPTEIRSTSNAIVTFLVSVALTVVSAIFPFSLKYLGFHGTFWFYGIMAFASGIYGFCTIAESKGKSLVAIEKNFDNGRGE